MERIKNLITPHYLMVAGLVIIWIAVLAALPAYLPLHLASWFAFLALLITPGYLLGDVITWKLDLDALERLALALPLGITVLAVPGITSLLLHLNIHQFALIWALFSGAILLLWLVHEMMIHRQRPRGQNPWKIDELILVGVIFIAFIAIMPTITLFKIDGDAYAVNSFTADALAEMPLNQKEPLFGTDLGPGVRMVFNQSLSLYYLWSYFSVIDANTLVATASKAMLAFWAILASYTLGKAAGNGSRRFGLLTAGIQLIIYMAAPFIRGDNVSLFFFERINADKFLVPVTMLPVIFAFAIIFIRDGGWRAWLAAATATLAVSAIHPLIAAMLALGIGVFGLLHLVLNLRRSTSWLRVVTLWSLIAIVMLIPMIQLALSFGESPMASSYPNSFEGWDIGEKQVPALPFVHVNSLDYYGPLPEMSELEASAAYEPTNPFLIWRFAVNMDRRRLILFDLNHYISDPSLIMEPPYFLAILLLPMFLWRLRRDVAAQFVVSVTIGILFVMFNPVITPLIGRLVMPWILWRFVWILPYALIFAMAAQMFINGAVNLVTYIQYKFSIGDPKVSGTIMARYGVLVFLIAFGLILGPGIARNISLLNGRIAFAYSYPTPEGIFHRLNSELDANGPAMVLAEQDLSVTLPAFVAKANILAHRTPTTSEVFPADQQDIALQRLIDQNSFFNTPYLTKDAINILQKYNAEYVVVESGSSLDLQLRSSPQWFTWLMDDKAYTLYKVSSQPSVDKTILGNTAMAGRDWLAARKYFEGALSENNQDLLAKVGLAEIAQREGQFAEVLSLLDQAIAQTDIPILHYRLGQLHAQQGRQDQSLIEFEKAQKAAPAVPRYHIALGDACLNIGNEECATEQYRQAVNLHDWPDESSRIVAEADLWRQKGFTERGIPLYVEAAKLQPSEYNLFVLISVYRELGLFDEATKLAQSMRMIYPLSAEVLTVQADLAAAQGQYDNAVALLRYAIWIEELKVQETTATHTALGEVLLKTDRLEEAGAEISYSVSLNPYAAAGHTLRGDYFHQRGDQEAAIRAYQRAFELDPSQIGVFVALSNELRQNGGTPNDVMVLLQIALREDAEDATLLLSLGDQWQRLGQTKAAIDAYQSALEQLTPYGRTSRSGPLASDDSRAFAFSRIATTYEDMGEMPAAMNYYQSAVAAAPDSPWTYLLLGDVQRRQNDIESAIKSYEKALTADKEFVEAYIRLGDLYTATGDSNRAEKLYERALELTNPSIAQHDPSITFASLAKHVPSDDALFASDETFVEETSASYSSNGPGQIFTADPLARTLDHGQDLALAQFYQGRDQGVQAIQLYTQRLEQGEKNGLSPTILARYHKELGDLHLVRYELAEAIAAYEQSIRLDSWTPAARLGLAEALALEEKFGDSLQQLETAVSLNPGAVEAQIALANALDDQGRSTEAMTIYVNTTANHPGNGQASLALARAWQARNRWDLAEQSFRNTIASNPGSADAYVGLAELQMDATDYDSAETLLKQAKVIDHNNISSYIRMGELEQRRGNTEGALNWYQEAALLPTADQSLNLTLIDSLISYGDYETALGYTRKALGQRPNDTELLLRYGRIQRIYGQYDQALESLTQAQANDPDQSRLYIELANLHLHQGDVRAALSAYEQAIDLQPTEATYYITASQLLTVLGEPERALELLREGLDKVDEPATLYNTIATIQLQQGKPDSALESLNTGLDILGDNTQMFLAMGNYYVNRGNFDQVMERYDQALKSQPDVADVHVALGDLHLRMGKTYEAIGQYRLAIEIDPSTPGHYLALGNAFEVAEDVAQAENAYKQALVAAPTLVKGYLSLAELYQANGKEDNAAEVYEEGLKVAPASGELLVQYATLKLAQDNDEDAFAMLDKAALVEPTAATYIRRAAIYADLEMISKAQADLEKALTIEPAAVEALISLGDLFKAQGDLQRAEEYFVQATRELPGVPTGYLRMATIAREAENRDSVVYWNDLARQAEPGGLTRPTD